MPRPQAFQGAGLRGPGQDIFPEQIKEFGRQLGLKVDEILVLRAVETSSAGATRITYVPDAQPVRGRLDPLGTGGRMGEENVVHESTSHIISVDYDVGITPLDRVRVHGNDWIINGEMERTDPLIARFEVQRADV